MKKTLVCVILAFSFLLGGCSWFSGKPGPITLVDDFDREVTLAEPAQRVVSLVPATTEIMFALGHGDRVVGASDFCNYPEAAGKFPGLAALMFPTSRPSFSGRTWFWLPASTKTVEGLEGLGIPVLALDPMTFEEIYANISLIARALGEEKAGEDLVADMQGRLEAVAQALGDLKEEERPLVFYESWYPGIWTAGEDTFIDEIIARAGGKNLAWGISRWVEMQEEEVLARNPDIIIHGYSEPLPVEPFAQRPGWDVGCSSGGANFRQRISPAGPAPGGGCSGEWPLFHPDS